MTTENSKIVFIAPAAGRRINPKHFLGYTPGGEGGGMCYEAFADFYRHPQFQNAECLPVARIEPSECAWGTSWRQVNGFELEEEAQRHRKLSKVRAIRSNKCIAGRVVKTIPWHDDDSLQFPRLLSKILAIGLPDETMAQLCASMDLKRSEILEILVRADREFEQIKQWDQMEQIKENSAPPQSPPGLYEVQVSRTAYSVRPIVINFDGSGSLEHAALDAAPNYIFPTENCVDYEVESWESCGDYKEGKSSGNHFQDDDGTWIKID